MSKSRILSKYRLNRNTGAVSKWSDSDRCFCGDEYYYVQSIKKFHCPLHNSYPVTSRWSINRNQMSQMQIKFDNDRGIFRYWKIQEMGRVLNQRDQRSNQNQRKKYTFQQTDETNRFCLARHNWRRLQALFQKLSVLFIRCLQIVENIKMIFWKQSISLK